MSEQAIGESIKLAAQHAGEVTTKVMGTLADKVAELLESYCRSSSSLLTQTIPDHPKPLLVILASTLEE